MMTEIKSQNSKHLTESNTKKMEEIKGSFLIIQMLKELMDPLRQAVRIKKNQKKKQNNCPM